MIIPPYILHPIRAFKYDMATNPLSRFGDDYS
jgi:hypothetical protein